MTKWSPSTYQLYHAKFCKAVQTVLLVAARLRATTQPDTLSVLPALIWRVLGELMQRDL